MSDNTIKAGDIVSIKSHPKMQVTVERVYDDEVICVWFHPLTNDFIRQKIEVSALVKWDKAII